MLAEDIVHFHFYFILVFDAVSYDSMIAVPYTISGYIWLIYNTTWLYLVENHDSYKWVMSVT